MLALLVATTVALSPPPSCADVDHLASPPSSHRTGFTLWNDTDAEVELDWLDFQGHRAQPTRVLPGERASIQSFEGHRFVVGAREKSCLGVLEVSATSPVIRVAPEGLVSDQAAIAAMFEKRELAGFTTFIDRRALAHPETTELLGFLGAEIPRCLALMHAHADVLRTLTLRIEWSPTSAHSASYRLDEREFLVRSAKQFLSNVRSYEPMVVCHELAHAVNHLAFRDRDPRILAAYAEALASEVYEHVEQDVHPPARAYALRSQDEYFAECTEAYFGYNDWYPHTREELRRFDPTGFALMEKIWGPLPPLPTIALSPCGAKAASKSEGTRTSLRFTNASARPISLGNIGMLEPGETRDLVTHVGDLFEVRDGAGTCLGVVTAASSPQVVVVGTPR